MSDTCSALKKTQASAQLLNDIQTHHLLVESFLLSLLHIHFISLESVSHRLFLLVNYLALAVLIMSRPYRQPRTLAHRDWYYSPYGHTTPRRPVILYVDLNGIPDIMESMSLPEAYTLTRDNIPALTEAEEEAIQTFMTYRNYGALDTSIRAILEDVYDHINRTWDSFVPNHSLGLSIINQVGTNDDLRSEETLRDVLDAHRPWWPREQDFEDGSRTRFRDPNAPFFLRLRAFRSRRPS